MHQVLVPQSDCIPNIGSDQYPNSRYTFGGPTLGQPVAPYIQLTLSLRWAGYWTKLNWANHKFQCWSCAILCTKMILWNGSGLFTCERLCSAGMYVRACVWFAVPSLSVTVRDRHSGEFVSPQTLSFGCGLLKCSAKK